jgi:hypothetical protein
MEPAQRAPYGRSALASWRDGPSPRDDRGSPARANISFLTRPPSGMAFGASIGMPSGSGGGYDDVRRTNRSSESGSVYTRAPGRCLRAGGAERRSSGQPSSRRLRRSPGPADRAVAPRYSRAPELPASKPTEGLSPPSTGKVAVKVNTHSDDDGSDGGPRAITGRTAA